MRRGQRPVEVSSTMSQGVQCTDCGREFSRPSGLKRHKCLAERAKPIEEQRGSVQCEECRKWFLSRGGLALHSCVAVNQIAPLGKTTAIELIHA